MLFHLYNLIDNILGYWPSAKPTFSYFLWLAGRDQRSSFSPDRKPGPGLHTGCATIDTEKLCVCVTNIIASKYKYMLRRRITVQAIIEMYIHVETIYAIQLQLFTKALWQFYSVYKRVSGPFRHYEKIIE